jgi:arsenate reductase
VAEVVATLGLVLVVLRADADRVPYAVGAYIAAAYWFTSSTSFANPAVTIGRTLSDTFAGIDPASVPAFLLAQVVGGVLGLLLVALLYPGIERTAGDVVVPHAHAADARGRPSRTGSR